MRAFSERFSMRAVWQVARERSGRIVKQADFVSIAPPRSP
jgi:hypothetical protein